MTYFLDTNICIHHLGGRSQNVRDNIMRQSNNIKIPSMVVAELFFGAEKSQQRKENLLRCKEFVSLFDIVDFDLFAAEHYADIRATLEKSGKAIGGNDMVIASIVRANSGVLITNNTKEFERVDGLLLEDWTTKSVGGK